MTGDITQWLNAARDGDPQALTRAFELLYAELRRLAASRLAQGGDATLSPTVLVHETYLRLFAGGEIALESRQHFFAAAAQAMRWIIVDHARRRLAERHGGGLVRVELDESLVQELPPQQVLELDQALERLARASPDKARLVELRFFAGLEFPELVALLGRSERSLKRDWASARAALHAMME
ncbi:MAG TPA: ECF-type sigma factor [Arenimonas sp.]|uniref:ECF-type sigma factor n=1 Tax=Arenimonas sp. TaxID=1872635 RepID=UPI002D80ACD6|nr:ECF-type sigma factor [Arenimonas sp.]HEU0152204.1 ECF-type sigma factor [Arenimonas sp.]